ncbi:MAG TPA: bifunctional precorrin-2 dehydrogenase/sirohydrochlorin ferrochelatase [Candidatus Hydrogenedentes bacterium]|nr:bifunctional precorrin-2 dehydrogenase/sirohydrochlorin ferrochelatase [Candidatus Hydrogenedentota bacterium]
MRVYPMGLKVAERLCVVVGGGRVAERKVDSLLACGANVTVVSPDLTPELEARAAAGEVTAFPRQFEPTDLDGAFLAIAATDDRSVNEAVAAAALARRVLVNVVDVPELCDYYVPASFTRGELLITVSTGGAGPALARRLREELEGRYGPEYDAYLALIARLRDELKSRVSSPEQRGRAMNAFLSSEALSFLREGREGDAEKLVKEYLAQAIEGETAI